MTQARSGTRKPFRMARSRALRSKLQNVSHPSNSAEAMLRGVTQGQFLKPYLQARIRHLSWAHELTCCQRAAELRLSSVGKFRLDAQPAFRASDEDATLEGVDDFQFGQPSDRQGWCCLKHGLIDPSAGCLRAIELQVESGKAVGVCVRNHAASSSPASQRSRPAVCSAVHAGMPRECSRPQ